MNNDSKTYFEHVLQKRLEERRSIIDYIVSHKDTWTRFEKVKDTVKHWLSYLTRYQIVDTWTIHDNCE